MRDDVRDGMTMSRTRNGARPLLKADLADRVARLERENHALRELLAAVQATADVPEPADWGENIGLHDDALAIASTRIAMWLSPSGVFGPVADWNASRLIDRAGLFREHLPLTTYPVREEA